MVEDAERDAVAVASRPLEEELARKLGEATDGLRARQVGGFVRVVSHTESAGVAFCVRPVSPLPRFFSVM